MGVNEFIQVGTRMKNFRQKQKMTQREVASKLNIPYSTYSNYENNNREPPLEVIKKVAVILGVSVSDLMDWDIKYDTAKLVKEVKQLEQTEKQALELFRGLNSSGQAKAMEYLRDISQIPEYINEP